MEIIMIKRLAAFVLAFMCIQGVCAEEFMPFKDNTSAAFVGGTEFLDNVFTKNVVQNIESEYGIKVNAKYISAEDDNEKYESIAEFKDSDIIFADFGRNNTDLVSIERTIRDILKTNKSSIIIGINMPNTQFNIDYSRVNELLESYSIPIVDLQDYFAKRIDIGILTANEIFSGNYLNEKGLEMAAQCINNVYNKIIYRQAVYRTEAISFKEQESDNKTEITEVGFTSEDAKKIVNSAVIADIYSNKVIIKGNKTEADRINSEIKPAKKGEMIMLPIRFVKDGLDAKITYNILNGKVTVSCKSDSITLELDNKQAELNGEEFILKESPALYDSVTYIPADAAAAVTGMNYFICDNMLIMYDGSKLQDTDLINTVKMIREGSVEL